MVGSPIQSEVVGNESDRHIRYKQRMANICRRFGYIVFGDRENEIAVRRDETNEPPYYCDLVAILGTRTIVIEVDGYKGHNSRRNLLRDEHRSDYIKENLIRNSDLEKLLRKRLSGKVELYRFGFWQLKDASDELIAQELQLC